jgi:hypothetical protein
MAFRAILAEVLTPSRPFASSESDVFPALTRSPRTLFAQPPVVRARPDPHPERVALHDRGRLGHDEVDGVVVWRLDAFER